MKTSIKLILAIMGSVLLPTKALAVTPDTQAILDAITNLNSNIQTNLANSTNTVDQQLTNLFNSTFVGAFTTDSSGNVTMTSTPAIYTVLNQFATNFYNWFSTNSGSGFSSDGLSSASGSLTIKPLSHPDIDDLIKNSDTISAIQNLLSKSTGYNIIKDPASKLLDYNSLLSQPLISDTDSTTDPNVIATSYLGLNGSTQNFTAFGGLDSNAPTANAAPSIIDLIGVDNYATNTSSTPSLQDKARLFISYILLSSPPPKNFNIPPKSSAKNGNIMMYLPVANNTANTSYTTVNIATDTDTTTYANQTIQNEYDRMLDTLNKDTIYYQPYQMKVRATNVLRSLYTECLIRAYQERMPDTSDNMSIVDKEKALAFSGLTQDYYNKLKKKSIADINLEMLQALNRLIYFVYKLHRDNERTALLMASAGIQLTSPGYKDDVDFVNPIGQVITNRCWDSALPNFQGSQAACNNPKSMQPANISASS